jgi:hypothetical protein
VSKRSAGDWLADPTTYTTCIALLLTERFDGIEWTQWDPLTLEMELRVNFELREIPRTLFDRTQAASVLYTTNNFHHTFDVFSNVCNVLNGGVINPSRLIPANLEDVMWGVTEARLITGISWEEEPFSTEIARYVGVLLDLKGISDPPYTLSFAEYPERTRNNEDLQRELDPLIAEIELGDSVRDKEELTQESMTQIQVLLDQIKALPLRNMDQAAYQKMVERLA